MKKEIWKELKEIIEFICQNSEVGMVILFGSYARGDWVEEYEDDGIHFKYKSDFDLLVIVSETCKVSEQKKLEQAIFKAINEIINEVKYLKIFIIWCSILASWIL